MTIEFDRSYSAADCRQEFVRAMKEAGIEFRGELVSDGQIHRFASGDSPYNDGYYAFYGISGSYGNYGRNIHRKWEMAPPELTRVDKILPQQLSPKKKLVALTAGELLSSPRELKRETRFPFMKQAKKRQSPKAL